MELQGPADSNGSSSLNFTFPPNFGRRPSDKALSISLVVMLFVTMISLGCTMEFAKIRAHLFKPKGVAIALVAQYGVMPLTAFTLGRVFQLNTIESLAILICGCSPGGSLSNVFSLAMKGDMNLSIVMTTCSTFSALALMLLLLYLYSLGLYEGTSRIRCPTEGSSSRSSWSSSPAPSVSSSRANVPSGSHHHCADADSCGRAVHHQRQPLHPAYHDGAAVGHFLPDAITGFFLGYLLSALFRLNGRCRRTVSMETGCQNVQLCSTILNLTFPLEVIGPLFYYLLLYIIFQVGEGLILIALFRCYEKIRTPHDDPKMIYRAVSEAASEAKTRPRSNGSHEGEERSMNSFHSPAVPTLPLEHSSQGASSQA
uniref:Solute carrier family 10 member 1 n=1 Tax=Ornithorhynchus anatinus TaxID=9258 RepID=A0A6I8P9U0_ORNAN